MWLVCESAMENRKKIWYPLSREIHMSTVEELNPQFVLDVNGNKKAVLLPIEEYEELLEDLSDLAVAAERRDENTMSHEQLLKEFNTDGSV